MEYFQKYTVGEIVTAHYRTAAIFNRHHVDFCCHGDKLLSEVCAPEKLQLVQLELTELLATPPNPAASALDYKSWSLDQLTRHIVDKHHRFVRSQIPALKAYLNKICGVHGAHHPELPEIRELFLESADELDEHMTSEERLLFPYIAQMSSTQGRDMAVPQALTSLQSLVENMKREHNAEGDRFRRINDLSNGYITPPDGCNTYRLTYALLKAYEEDLHLHIHLENNILFPRAIIREKEIFRAQTI